MIGLTIHIGGEVLQGPHGVYYSLEPVTMITVRSGLSYVGLRETIYQQLGLDEGQFDLRIQARISFGTSGQTWFQLVPVINDETWTLMYTQTANLGTGYKILELYVEAIPIGSYQPSYAVNPGSYPGSFI